MSLMEVILLKIYVLGDVHGEWGELNKLINTKHPDIILQCGDFGFWPHMFDITIKNYNTKIYWLPGNHENWDILLHDWDHTLLKNREILPNIYYMRRNDILELNGKNILFFGGGDSIDKMYRRLSIGPWDEHASYWTQEIPTERDLDSLPMINVDMVLSHTCPQYFKLKTDRYDKIHDPTRKMLDIVYDRYQPRNWYFAHWHTYISGVYKDCNYVGLNREGTNLWYRDISHIFR